MKELHSTFDGISNEETTFGPRPIISNCVLGNRRQTRSRTSIPLSRARVSLGHEATISTRGSFFPDGFQNSGSYPVGMVLMLTPSYRANFIASNFRKSSTAITTLAWVKL